MRACKLTKLGLIMSGATVLVMSQAAAAQTGATPVPAPPEPEAAASEADGGEIIVTAQKRPERLVDVPLSITALNGQTLAQTGVGDTRTLTQAVPGLNFQTAGSVAQPVIRGIGSTGLSLGDASNVAIYVDGVYLPSQQSSFYELVDLERIEVLKGPQGTLFGRNAAGGAISITTLSPSFTPSGRIGVSYGRFDERNAILYATGPIAGDAVAGSLSVNYKKDDGFRPNVFNGDRLGSYEVFNSRAKLLFKPSDVVDVTVTGYYNDSDDLRTFGNQPLDGNTTGGLFPGVILARKPNTVALNITPIDEVRDYGGNIRLVADLGAVSLTSITGYNNTRNFVFTDSDVTPLPISQSTLLSHDESVSQELDIASQGEGPLSFIGGLYFFRNDVDQVTQSFGSTAASNFTAPIVRTFFQFFENETTSYAAFSELTYALTDRFTVVGGLRYTHDRTSYDGERYNPATGAITLTRSLKASFDNVSPRLSLRYELADRVNSYFTYSRGFKAGVFNAQGFPTSAVDPEKIDAFEVGLKGAPSRTFSFDLAAFHYRYRDQQVSAFGATSIAPLLQNVPGTSKIYGLEGNVQANLTDEFNVRAGASYTHARYGDFPGPQAFVRNVANGGFGNLTPPPAGLNARGEPFLRTPEVQAYVGLNYKTELAGGELQLNGFTSYTSKIRYEVFGNFAQKGYSVTNASVSYTTADRHWRATLFGTNIFDETYLASVLVSNAATAVSYARPATYGVRLEYLF